MQKSQLIERQMRQPTNEPWRTHATKYRTRPQILPILIIPNDQNCKDDPPPDKYVLSEKEKGPEEKQEDGDQSAPGQNDRGNLVPSIVHTGEIIR